MITRVSSPPHNAAILTVIAPQTLIAKHFVNEVKKQPCVEWRVITRRAERARERRRERARAKLNDTSWKAEMSYFWEEKANVEWRGCFTWWWRFVRTNEVNSWAAFTARGASVTSSCVCYSKTTITLRWFLATRIILWVTKPILNLFLNNSFVVLKVLFYFAIKNKLLSLEKKNIVIVMLLK